MSSVGISPILSINLYRLYARGEGSALLHDDATAVQCGAVRCTVYTCNICILRMAMAGVCDSISRARTEGDTFFEFTSTRSIAKRRK